MTKHEEEGAPEDPLAHLRRTGLWAGIGMLVSSVGFALAGKYDKAAWLAASGTGTMIVFDLGKPTYVTMVMTEDLPNAADAAEVLHTHPTGQYL